MSPKEIERHVKNLDFVMGGCEVDKDSPTVRPICTTCGFGYNSRTKRWSRNSRDVRSFKRSFTPMLTSFPILQLTKTLEYEQSVRNNRVVAEGVVYTANRDHPELKEEINQWFIKYGIKVRYDESKGGDGSVRQWHAPHISIRFSYESGELFVWLVHDLEREKSEVL